MSKDKIQYRILVIEDNPGDAALIADFLKKKLKIL